MKSLQTQATMRMIVAVALMLLIPSQGVQGLQVSPPPSPGMPRNCEAERTKRYMDAARQYDNSWFAIDQKRKAAFAGCQDAFSNVDVPACTRKLKDSLDALAAQGLVGTYSCLGVCSVAIVPPAVMAPACAACFGTLYVAIAYKITEAFLAKNTCLQTAQDTANKCSRDAQRAAAADLEIARRVFDQAIADADSEYQRCKAGAGG